MRRAFHVRRVSVQFIWRVLYIKYNRSLRASSPPYLSHRPCFIGAEIVRRIAVRAVVEHSPARGLAVQFQVFRVI